MAPQRGTHAASSQRRELKEVVGLGRLELPTSRLSSARSNQLSYKPMPRPHLRFDRSRDLTWRSGRRGRAAGDDPRLKNVIATAPRTWRGLVQEERETETAGSRQWTSTA